VRDGSSMQQGCVADYQCRKKVMAYLKGRVKKYEGDPCKRYIELLTRCDAIVVLKPRMAKQPDSEHWVRQIAIVEDVGILFLETEGGIGQRQTAEEIETTKDQ
jgi:hypothetical protein